MDYGPDILPGLQNLKVEGSLQADLHFVQSIALQINQGDVLFPEVFGSDFPSLDQDLFRIRDPQAVSPAAPEGQPASRNPVRNYDEVIDPLAVNVFECS